MMIDMAGQLQPLKVANYNFENVSPKHITSCDSTAIRNEIEMFSQQQLQEIV